MNQFKANNHSNDRSTSPLILLSSSFITPKENKNVFFIRTSFVHYYNEQMPQDFPTMFLKVELDKVTYTNTVSWNPILLHYVFRGGISRLYDSLAPRKTEFPFVSLFFFSLLRKSLLTILHRFIKFHTNSTVDVVARVLTLLIVLLNYR